VSDYVVCPACGTPNDAADAFCGACGASLRVSSVPPVLCWNCGIANPVGRAWCRQCGQHLGGSAAATALPPVTPQQGARRSPVLLALAVVLMAFVGLAAGFLILTLGDGRDGGTAVVAPSATPSTEPVESLPPVAAATPPPRPRRTPQPTPTLGPPAEFACYQSAQSVAVLNAPAGTTWDLTRIDFRTYPSYDRVIYQLRRTGVSDGAIEPAAWVKATIGASDGDYVGPDHPFAGDERLNVLLVNGVRDRVRIARYEPRGMRIVGSVSTYPYRSLVAMGDPADDPFLADVGVLSIVDVTGEGCHALRAVGWEEGSEAASVYVDIRR
jgi:hypothetical protein